MLLLSLLLAPAVMAGAGVAGRRFGPSAAGWVAALPISFAVAVLAVTLDAGPRTAGAVALSAAAHVPAQVAFGVAFAGMLLRRGPLAGLAVGTLAYAAGSFLLAGVPAAPAVVLAIPALALAPRLMTRSRPRPSGQRPRARGRRGGW